ncbi:MAG: hypothetical protein B6242_04855 [Anaerolineaceae bacterium 4572_78]|nr:MAG: hypothetical protein B6242_04855 [Anaerolineaceae bacterium 4572_78]
MSAKHKLIETITRLLNLMTEGITEFDVELVKSDLDLTDEEHQNLEQALSALRGRLNTLSTAAEEVAGGKLPTSVFPASERDRLGIAFGKMLGNIRKTIAQVDAGANALGASETNLADTANNASDAVETIVAAFGKVTSHTFSQLASIKQVKTELEKLTQLIPDMSDEIQQIVQSIQDEMDTIADASQESAKVTVGLRLTTNKMLDQIDRIVVSSRGLRGMSLGLRSTLAPYILVNNELREKTIRIAYLPIADHLVLPLTYLQQMKITNGLPLKLLRCSSWPQLIDHLEDDADGAMILSPLALKIFSDGLPIKAIMSVHRNGSGLILSKEIDGIQDLPGRIVAIPHTYSTHNVLLYLALKNAGIPYGAVEVMRAPPPLMPYFLQRGTLDGFVSAEPFPEVALNIGAGDMEFLSKDLISDHICCVLVMRDHAIKRNPENITRLANIFIETGKSIAENPANAAKNVAPFFGVVPEVMERVLTSPSDRITYDDLELRQEELFDFGKSMVDMGLLRDIPDIDEMLRDEFFREAMSF